MDDNKEELTLFDTEETGKQEPLIEQPPGEPEETIDPKLFMFATKIAEANSKLTELGKNPLVAEFFKQTEQLKRIAESFSSYIDPKISPVFADNIAKLFKNDLYFEIFDKIARASTELQKDLTALGVESTKLSDALQLFPEDIQEAFIDILNLARSNIDKGLLLKDYAEAINADLTVKADFPLKEELEQILENAAEYIKETRILLEKEAKSKQAGNNIKQGKESKIKALQVGATITPKYLATFSRKDMAGLFTTQCIRYVADDITNMDLFDEFGQLRGERAIKEFEQLTEIHADFLMLICAYLSTKLIDSEGSKIQVIGKDATIRINLADAANKLKLDPRKNAAFREGNESLKQLRYEMFKGKILPFEKFVGFLPNGSCYRVLLFKGYDSETDTMLLESPYIYKAFEMRNNTHYALSLNVLFHRTIVGEPPAAIEMAAAMLAVLKQRGISYKKDRNPKAEKVVEKTKGKTVTTFYQDTPDTPQEEKPFTFKENWKSFIEKKCPQLSNKLDAVMASDKKNKAMYFNKILADTVKVAYRIIKEKSDAFLFYKDLKFEPCYTNGELKAPTKSQLAKTFLVIKHKGKNKAYQDVKFPL